MKIILSILIVLFIPIFGISNDVSEKPFANKTETVKDRFGIDTGMTQKEMLEFESNYYKKCNELGIQKGQFVAPGSYFKYKINLNSIEELNNLGLFLSKDYYTNEERLAFSITHSEIIVVGTIDSVEYFHKTEEEEWKVKPGWAMSRYFIKIENILKGKELFKSIPKKISYLSSIGKFLTISNDRKMKMGCKYLMFFEPPQSKIEEFKKDFKRKRKFSISIHGNQLKNEYGDILNLSYEDAVLLINKYNKVNDIEKFYKRNYNLEKTK